MLVSLLIFLALTLFVYLKIWKPHQFFKENGLVHLKPWLIIGNFPGIVLRYITFTDEIENLCNKFKNKRFFGVYQLLTPIVVIQDPELIKKVTVKDFEHFVDHQNFVSTSDVLWQKNMYVLNGEKWKDMRGTLSPVFTGSKMRIMFNLIRDCSDKFAQHFVNKRQKALDLEMKEVFTRFTTDVMATTVFGFENDSLSEEKNEFFVMGQEATDFSGWKSLAFFLYMLSPRIANLFKIKLFTEKESTFFRKIVKDAINYREESNVSRPDMLQLLIEAKKGKLKYEEDSKNSRSSFAIGENTPIVEVSRKKGSSLVLTDDDIAAQALLFFFGGFDAVSTLMCHMAYELALNPDVHAKLQQEVDDTLEACNRKVTYDALMHMKYMDMVIFETLRKWPPSPVTDRICTKTYTISPENDDEKPYTIEKGNTIWIPTYCLHRNPEYFPNPEKFDPERFSDETKSSIQPFTYMPFSVGPRACIGPRFALMETKALFCSLLTQFNIVPVEKTRNPLVLSKKHFNMTAEGGFWVGFETRKKID